MIAVHINENPAVRSVNIELQRVLNHGAESEWTHRHIGEVTARLSAWCVANNRYFANVAVKQKLDPTYVDLACSPLTPNPPWWRFWASRGGERVSGELAPFASATLSESDLVLIDAPISMNLETADHDAYLCDFPPVARKVEDARLPLILSAPARRQLAEYFSAAPDWMPFCRTLAIVRNRRRGQVLEVLQISSRIPRFPERDWWIGLIDEADTMQSYKAYTSDDDHALKEWIVIYRITVEEERKNHANADDAALARECGAQFASEMLSLGRDSVRSHLKLENSPYGNAEGFWACLAPVLAAGRDRFPLTRAQVDTLLRKFDLAYDADWKSSMRDLAMSGLFRFTPDVMAKIRAQIDALPTGNAPGSSPAVLTQQNATSAA